MNKVNLFTIKISKVIMISLAFIFMSCLFMYSMFKTCYGNIEYDGALSLKNDNVFINLFLMIIAILVTYCIVNFLSKVSWLTSNIIILIECVILGCICFWWVFHADTYPIGDQKMVAKLAIFFIDPNQVKPELVPELIDYAQRFPYQLGIVSIFETIFRLFGCDNDYEKLHAFNCILYVLSVFFLAKITQKMFQNKKVVLYEAFLSVFCLPWLVLTPFIYGDVPFLAFGLGAIFFSLQYHETEKNRYAVCAVIFAAICCIAKPNALILMIALIIVEILKAVQERKIKYVIFGIIIAIASFGALPCVKQVYLNSDKIEFGKGSPMYGNVYMGLSESLNPGWYTGYVIKVYDDYAGNDEAMTLDAKAHIKERLQVFANDIPYAYEFFKTKTATQWNEPTFDSLQANDYHRDTMIPVIEKIYYDEQWHNLFVETANRYQSILYGMFLAYIIFLVKKPFKPSDYIFILYFIGGFLFQLIWEGSSRYVIYYMIPMIPCAAYAVDELITFVHKCFVLYKKNSSL